MKQIIIAFALFALPFTSQAQGLKDAIGRDCLIGAALNHWQALGQDDKTNAIVTRHFNVAVAENCMKGQVVQPSKDVFNFELADQFVDYCEQNHLAIIGHCLVWHSQAPVWFFLDKSGYGPCTREELITRIRKHIKTVVGRYRGQVKGWDVVNEAFNEDGTLRKSPLYNIIGEDFIEIAFRAAHEADPDAELYYNDYNMSSPAKREAVCRMVKDFKAKGIRIDAVGMQSHNGLDYPNLAEYEKSIEAFAACGVKVMFTELDVNVLPSPDKFSGAEISQNFAYQQKLNPYVKGLTPEAEKQFEQRYLDLFKIYYRHRKDISRITLWGISDRDTWLNNFPVAGRTNYPLLFDRDYKEKPVVKKIMDMWK